MTIGAFIGAVAAYYSGNGWLGFFCGGLAGAAFGVLHAVACVTFGADQTISGTAINFIAPGLAVFLCKAMFENSSDSPALDTASKTAENVQRRISGRFLRLQRAFHLFRSLFELRGRSGGMVRFLQDPFRYETPGGRRASPGL